MATAIARMHTAIPAAHQIVAALRGGLAVLRGAGRAPAPGAGGGAGRTAARAARLDPSPSTPAGGSVSPRSSTTMERAVGRTPGPVDMHSVASVRSGSGSTSRSAGIAGPPTPAYRTVKAQARRAPAGGGAPEGGGIPNSMTRGPSAP